MSYIDYTRDELIARIESLERLNQELLSELDRKVKLEYAWTGNLGRWYVDLKSSKIALSPLQLSSLGYDEGDLPENVSYRFILDTLHPDDLEHVMDTVQDHLIGETDMYEVEYRIQTKSGKYKFYYNRGKVTQFDADGKPEFISGIVFDVTERREVEARLRSKNERLAKLSFIDGLTNIYNHRTIVEKLRLEMEKACETGEPLSIALLDIDDFKWINDNKGHIYGDKVLIDVSETMLKLVKGLGIVGRYGGEEFIVVYKNTDQEAAFKITEHLRQTIESKVFIDGLKVTVSGGVKQYQGEEKKALIHEADKRLYQAKNNGKNRIVSHG